MKKLALPFVMTTVLSPALIDCNKEKDPAGNPSQLPADAPKPAEKERIYRNPPKPSHEPADPPKSDEKSEPADKAAPTDKKDSGSASKTPSKAK